MCNWFDTMETDGSRALMPRLQAKSHFSADLPFLNIVNALLDLSERDAAMR
jgi:hypothetical protein